MVVFQEEVETHNCDKHVVPTWSNWLRKSSKWEKKYCHRRRSVRTLNVDEVLRLLVLQSLECTFPSLSKTLDSSGVKFSFLKFRFFSLILSLYICQSIYINLTKIVKVSQIIYVARFLVVWITGYNKIVSFLAYFLRVK